MHAEAVSQWPSYLSVLQKHSRCFGSEGRNSLRDQRREWGQRGQGGGLMWPCPHFSNSVGIPGHSCHISWYLQGSAVCPIPASLPKVSYSGSPGLNATFCVHPSLHANEHVSMCLPAQGMSMRNSVVGGIFVFFSTVGLHFLASQIL